ncbi:hypothetical protein CC80DRAFT_462668 [Byssothecium circinans]|uniref:Uncharacterized protein n=1 Tax=Byssothecium circinans TaxID=147558 RepID=A0A6A5UEZ7_9PLEO|nr:hypothetical protein CC80DRAFT_462668 [Byssothecium circinans]
MSDAWFSEKLAPDGDIEDGCHPEEAAALKDYVYHNTTATEAAHAITRPILLATNPGEDLARLWGFLEDALVELPSEYIEPLLELLKAIEHLPGVELPRSAKSDGPSEKLWKGLSGFGHMWSDSYMSGNWRDIARDAEGNERDALRAQHVRRAEVEARIVTAGLADIPIDWGYEVMSDALESVDALLDFEVPAAAQWLHVCGARFREGAEKGEKSWGLKPRSRLPGVSSPELRKAVAAQVMSLERWAFWEERLKSLQGESGVVQDAALKAWSAVRLA